MQKSALGFWYKAAAPPGPGLVMEETWESPGTDLTWSAFPTAAWDPDNTVNPLDGTQDLRKNPGGGSDGFTYHALPGTYSSFFCAMRFRMNQSVIVKNPVFWFADAAGQALCSARITFNSTPEAYRIYLGYNSDSQEIGDTSLNYNRSGILYLKLIYNASGEVRFIMTDEADYLSNGGFNSPNRETLGTTTTDTADVGRVYIYSDATSHDCQWGDIRGNDTDSGVDF